MGLYYKGKRIVGLIFVCLGIGTLLVIILPFWGWLLIGGIGLICIGWHCIRR